jgi:hypothetical protein
MQSDDALRSIEALIEHHWQIVAALEKARDLMRGGAAVAPVAQKALPPPARKPARKVPEVAADFTQEIDGVSFACTEQQHAFIEMLGEHEYVRGPMAFPLFDGNERRFDASLKDLRARLVAANVQAQIVGYRKQGYRLEKIEAEAP